MGKFKGFVLNISCITFYIFYQQSYIICCFAIVKIVPLQNTETQKSKYLVIFGLDVISFTDFFGDKVNVELALKLVLGTPEPPASM